MVESDQLRNPDKSTLDLLKYPTPFLLIEQVTFIYQIKSNSLLFSGFHNHQLTHLWRCFYYILAANLNVFDVLNSVGEN